MGFWESGGGSDRDEVFVRRLETFGDIVIGFSLAELGLSLIVPAHARSLIDNTTWFSAYVWTFALVCMMWAGHYWTFRHVFVPTRLTLLLNYAKLAFIVLLVFMVQVLMRAFQFGSARDVIVANELYWGCLCAYWIVAGWIILIGVRLRAGKIEPTILQNATRRVWRMAASAVMIVIGFVVSANTAPWMATVISIFMIAGMIAGSVGGSLATRASASRPEPNVSERR
jgi:uncharacterized membrane protein